MKKNSLGILTAVHRYVEEAILSEELIIREIDISYVHDDVLKNIFIAEDDDPELYLGYDIDEKIALELNTYLKEPIIYDFSKYSYCLGTYGVYKNTDED